MTIGIIFAVVCAIWIFSTVYDHYTAELGSWGAFWNATGAAVLFSPMWLIVLAGS